MRLTKRAQENVMAGLLLAVFVGFAAVALTYGPRARFVPLTVAVASIALMVLQLVVQNRATGRAGARDEAGDEKRDREPGPRRGAGADGAEGGAAPAGAAEAGGAAPAAPVDVLHTSGGTALGGIALVAAFVVAIIALGMLPAALAYVFGYFRWVARARTWVAALYGAGIWGALYLLFVVFLQVPMYQGYLGALLSYVG